MSPLGLTAWLAFGGGFFDDFATFEEIEAYTHTLAEMHDDAVLLDLGDSVEGRSLTGLSLSHADSPPTLLVLGTQHAREWISPMVTMCIADHLVRDDGVDSVVTDLLDRVEVIVVPVVNPDGYVYSWEVERLWRKNRRPGGGVDLNRNWDHMWGVGAQGAGPSAENYPGPAALSEPETQAIVALAESREVVAFLDYHSAASLVLIPFAYTPDPSPNEATQVAWGEAMAETISAVHGVTHGLTKPGVGNPSGGLAQDFFAGELDAIAFTIELRAGPGQSVFELPAAEIIDACEENWAGFLDLATRVSARFGVDPPAGTDDGGQDETGDADASGSTAHDLDGPGDGAVTEVPGEAESSAAATSGGTAGSDGPADAADSDPATGCACRAAPGREGSAPGFGLALLGVALRRRRRRR